MIGGPRYAFAGREPLAYRIIGLFTVCLFTVFWLLGFTSRWWAPQSPDATWSYGVHFKGGIVYYYRPAVGWFVENGLWLCFALFGVLLLIMWFNRDQVKRVP